MELVNCKRHPPILEDFFFIKGRLQYSKGIPKNFINLAQDNTPVPNTKGKKIASQTPVVKSQVREGEGEDKEMQTDDIKPLRNVLGNFLCISS